MKRYIRKKVKAKHINHSYELSPCKKCINDKINYLKNIRRGLIISSALSGTLSLIGLSSIALVKDNNIGQITLDIILSSCAAGMSYCLANEAKETGKQLTLLKKKADLFN